MVYGDTSDLTYRDVAPADGIDDVRAARLTKVADRFLPILRKNNFSVPRRFADIPAATTMFADYWVNGRLVSKDSIRIDQVATDSAMDARLARLLSTLGPRRVIPAITQPRARSELVALIDFPGADEDSWRAAYDTRDARAQWYAASELTHCVVTMRRRISGAMP